MIPAEILEQVRRIEIHTRRLVNDVLAGHYGSVFRGRGMEFSEVREYMPGDEIRDIDWNVTARMGQPFIKKFVEERELTTMLLVDASASGAFGSSARSKTELAAEFSALIAASAIRNNDKVGLIIFTDQVERYIPPKKGRGHVMRVIREVLGHKPQRTGTCIREAIELFSRVTRRHAVTFLVSDFIDKDFEKPLRIAAQSHDLIAVRVTDPREQTLPTGAGLMELRDPETGHVQLIDASHKAVRRAFEQAAEKRTEALADLFKVPLYVPMFKARYLVRAKTADTARLTYCVAGP